MMKNNQKGSRIVSNQRIFYSLIVLTLLAVVYLSNFTVYTNGSKWDISFRSVLEIRSSIYGLLTITTQGRNYLSKCPTIPPGLQGRLLVNTNISDWTHIEKDITNVTSGGRYKPPECLARYRVAIVIPYRDRERHLKVFLRHLHPFLQRQQLDYRIYVVEMLFVLYLTRNSKDLDFDEKRSSQGKLSKTQGLTFNRALLMNIGFVEAMKLYDYQCFIFHDVDLLPEDDRNLYTCPTVPRHMSTAVDSLKYELLYPTLFGGVVAIPSNQFKLINGYSNSYFGWGGEDDDFYTRIVTNFIIPERYSGKFARYKMLTHELAPRNPKRDELLKKVKERQTVDGLSSLKYSLIRLEKKPLFTWILVSVNISELTDLSEEINKTESRKGLLQLSKKVQEYQKWHQQIQIQNNELPKNKVKENERLQVRKIKELIKQGKIDLSIVNGKKGPPYVNWVPKDYEGKIPDHLNKF